MLKLINDLWLKPRDIVSDGFDESLDYIAKIIPLKIEEIPSGTECWTWIIPEKWSVGEAYVEDLDGHRVLDAKDHPLHIVSYSLPINRIVAKEDLLLHLHTNPSRPKAIPFEFKYYERDWGFCVEHDRLRDFTQDNYRVVINSKFEPKKLKVGCFEIKGKSPKTIVLLAHLCHRGQANDGLSGVSVLVDIARNLKELSNYYTYKFLFVPETIGSIAYLYKNRNKIPQFKYGIFLEMLGNDNTHALQLSRQGNTRLDRVARHILHKKFGNVREGRFREITRNDEMVFNGPGINIPTISLSRSPFPQYHTSDDNPDIISEKNLAESKETVMHILAVLDQDYIPRRKFTGPIFLSRYGLWVDWRKNMPLNANIEQIMLSLEGDRSVFDIAEELEMDFFEVLNFINKLHQKGLIEKYTAL